MHNLAAVALPILSRLTNLFRELFCDHFSIIFIHPKMLCGSRGVFGALKYDTNDGPMPLKLNSPIFSHSTQNKRTNKQKTNKQTKNKTKKKTQKPPILCTCNLLSQNQAGTKSPERFWIVVQYTFQKSIENKG